MTYENGLIIPNPKKQGIRSLLDSTGVFLQQVTRRTARQSHVDQASELKCRVLVPSAPGCSHLWVPSFLPQKKDQKGIKGLYPLDRFSPQAVLSYAINSTSLDHVQHFAGYMFRIVQGSTKVEDSGPITHGKMSMHRNVRPNRPISVSVAPEMFAEHRKLTPQDLRIDTATAQIIAQLALDSQCSN